MGHCKPMEDGYVPDDCWRRVNFEQTEDDAVMQMEGYYDYEKLPCP
jgi:hypothetical protein